MAAAAYAHADYDIDTSKRIDVFDVIDRAGLLLAFEPFRKLSGAFLRFPDADVEGIVINSLHPLARQRYSAAHEFGHFRLGHASSIDPESEPLSRWGGAAVLDDHRSRQRRLPRGS